MEFNKIHYIGLKDWNDILLNNFADDSDIYYQSEYFQLYSDNYYYSPEAIYWENKHIKIFWTHLKCKEIEFNQNKDFNSEFFSFTTPYGYGGPLIHNKTEDEGLIQMSFNEFFRGYCDLMKANGHKNEFIRHHPQNDYWKYLENFENVINSQINDVIFVDLKLDENDIYMGFRKNIRQFIKKGKKLGCEVIFRENPSEFDIKNFLKIYYDTMDQNKANLKYYFSEDFIADHFKYLDIKLFEAIYEGRIIGSLLVLVGDNILHYYLSGTEKNIKNINANTSILWEVIKYGQKIGKNLFHLGGGRGQNDSLYEYKKGFSKFSKPFNISKITF